MNSYIKPASACPKLTELAYGCANGACNMSGIILSLGEIPNEVDRCVLKDHPAVKMILGQLSYLCDESAGPTPEAVRDYDWWRAWSEVPGSLTFEQYRAIQLQKERWAKVGEPQPVIGGDGAVAVDVGSMVLCIEKDGHCHS